MNRPSKSTVIASIVIIIILIIFLILNTKKSKPKKSKDERIIVEDDYDTPVIQQLEEELTPTVAVQAQLNSEIPIVQTQQDLNLTQEINSSTPIVQTQQDLNLNPPTNGTNVQDLIFSDQPSPDKIQNEVSVSQEEMQNDQISTFEQTSSATDQYCDLPYNPIIHDETGIEDGQLFLTWEMIPDVNNYKIYVKYNGFVSLEDYDETVILDNLTLWYIFPIIEGNNMSVMISAINDCGEGLPSEVYATE